MDEPRFLDDKVLQIGDTLFRCEFPVEDHLADQLPVTKKRPLVERCIRLAEDLAPQTMVEVGIFRGGSTALWAELLQPRKLVAVELSTEPVAVLQAYIDRRGLGEVVRPHYGVDQADRARLEDILRTEFEGAPLDLVFDDASHRYAPTRTTFEVLFPHLRPGGVYVIEDWSDKHLIADAFAAKMADTSAPDHQERLAALKQRLTERRANDEPVEVPLTQLAVELLVARASRGDLIRSVTAEADWILVTKGDDPVTPGAFRLGDHVRDHEGFLPHPQGS